MNRICSKKHQATYKALLRYCELDTFAMVIIWEACREIIQKERI